MNNKDLRKTVLKVFSNYPGIQIKPGYSVVNDGFPGTFNLSLSEPECLDEFGNYLDYDKSLIYGKIQPIIRPNDFEQIIVKMTDKKHLGLFDLAGITALDIDKNQIRGHLHQMIDILSRLLFEELKLDPKKLYVKLCAGGSINELTDGKYPISKTIGKDNASCEKWKEQGVPEKNFIWDSTRDTFLSLFLFGRPSPWGCRNELLYDVGEGVNEENLLDIGSVEHFSWRPVFAGKEETSDKVKDIADWEHCAVMGGVGLERLLMAVNGFDSAMKCDHIQPLFQAILSQAKNQDEEAAFVLIETLRAVQRIFIDSAGYANLSKNRQEKLKPFIEAMSSSLDQLGISSKKIRDFLAISAKLQDFYPELGDFDFAAREIGKVFEKKFKEYPAWPTAKFYEGTEGLKLVVDELLKEKGVFVDAIFSSKMMKFIPYYHNSFRKLRQERNIFMRVISDRGKEIVKRKIKDKEELRKIKFNEALTQDLDTAIYIYGNKLAMITATERERGGMIIENKEIATILKRLFGIIWEKAKED